MNFEVCTPLRIQTQAKPDECTSCALAAIAEDILKVPVDPMYIYQNSSDGKFGITADQALTAVFKKGILAEGSSSPVFPFKDCSSPWPWVFRFCSIIKMMQQNQRSFFCGIYWQPEWDRAIDGIMVMPTEWLTLFPHAVKIFGVIEKNGVPYLKVQNSMGKDKGDNGIWYMPREIAQKLYFAYQLA